MRGVSGPLARTRLAALHAPADLRLAPVDPRRNQSLWDSLGGVPQRPQRHDPHRWGCGVDGRLVVSCPQTALDFSALRLFFEHDPRALFLALLAGAPPGSMDLYRFRRLGARGRRNSGSPPPRALGDGDVRLSLGVLWLSSHSLV